MLRLRQPQESLWDQLLPPQARTLSDELTTVDIWLADERFFEPYRQRFRTRVGALLPSAFAQHVRTIGRVPRAAATDRGFGSKRNEGLLVDAGVQRISLPYTGRVGPARRRYEGQGWFRRLQRWRAGQEATISLGSRKYAWRQSRLRGRDGTDIWLGLGVLTANLQRLVILEGSMA